LKFTEFDLRQELIDSIEKIGFSGATPIQELVIPQVLRGKDVSGLAQTGTGKTAAFVVPLIDRILRFRAGEEGERVPKNWKKNSYVLVLVPTRELAVQVEQAVVQFGKNANIGTAVVVGGAGYDEQRRALRSNAEFVVGTPGRLLDLYKSHDLDLNSVGAIVFDEADRMFDMGFKDDMKYILRRVPRDRQFLLFSATLNFEVLNTAYQFGAEPVEFNVSRDSVTAEGIDHEILHVGQDEKPMYLLSVIKKMAPNQCMVFSNFKFNVRPIARFLKDNGFEATEMSSLLSQAQRNRVLESFRTGKQEILVATDVAARGLDIKGVDLVVNFDLPDDPEGYVHRIGRTGRAGGSGRAIGLVSDRDVEALMRVETYLKEKLKVGWMEETELIKDFKPFVRERESYPSRPGGGGPRPARPGGGRGRSGPGAGRPPQRPQNSSAPRGPARPPQGPTNSVGRDHDRRPHDQRGGPATPPKPRVEQGPRSPNQGPSAPFTPSAAGQQHRDRRLGRHGGIAGAATGGAPQQQQGRGPNQGRGRQGSSGGRSPHHGRQGHQASRSNGSPSGSSQNAPQRRPLRKGGEASQKSSVGQKIKTFISKWFR